MTDRAARLDGKKLKLPAGARYWFTLPTVAGDYDFILGNPEIFPDLKDRNGVTLAEECLVVLDDTQPYKRLCLTAFHEIMHSVLSTPGERELLALLFGCKPKQSDEREERFVTHVAPKLGGCLFDAGMLSFPPIPKKR